jgi:hypothetical protein
MAASVGRVVAQTGQEEVVPIAARQVVVVEAAHEVVVPKPADQDVVPVRRRRVWRLFESSEQRVVPVPAVDRVDPGASLELVGDLSRRGRGALRGSDQEIVGGSADDVLDVRRTRGHAHQVLLTPWCGGTSRSRGTTALAVVGQAVQGDAHGNGPRGVAGGVAARPAGQDVGAEPAVEYVVAVPGRELVGKDASDDEIFSGPCGDVLDVGFNVVTLGAHVDRERGVRAVVRVPIEDDHHGLHPRRVIGAVGAGPAG